MNSLTEVLTELLEAEVSQAAYAEAMYWEERAIDADFEEWLDAINRMENEDPEEDRWAAHCRKVDDDENGPYGWRTTGFRDGAMIW